MKEPYIVRALKGQFTEKEKLFNRVVVLNNVPWWERDNDLINYLIEKHNKIKDEQD